MIIDGKTIAEKIIEFVKKETKKLKKKPHLAVFLVNKSPDNLSFVKAKEKAVKEIGGTFTLFDFSNTPEFEKFANKIREVANDSTITGVIIQKPLPSALNTESLFNYIPIEKEIEGHRKKTEYFPPLGLAITTVLKTIFKPFDDKSLQETLSSPKKDFNLLRKVLKRKKIVLIGKGETGGKPLGKFLNEQKINFINTHSKTPNSEYFYKEADIIITAVGKKILSADTIKNQVVLVNVGLHKTEKGWSGDFDENEVKDKAMLHTPTPGGVGPIDVAFLIYNLFLATKTQK